jgi:hypothetical protein
MRARAEIRGAEAEDVDALATAVHAGDVIGDAVGALALHAVDHRADHRVIVDEPGRLLRIAAGEEALVAAAVVGEVVGDGADDRVFIGDPRVHRQIFGDVDAGDVRVDRVEFAAIFGRGVGLEVVHLHVRRPAGQPDEDDGIVGGRIAGFVRAKLPRRDAAGGQCEGAHLEELSTRRTRADNRLHQTRSTREDRRRVLMKIKG